MSAARKRWSLAKRRQTELAWLLYITEGMRANVEHAQLMNCATLNNADHAALRKLQAALRGAARELRERLTTPL